MVRIQIDGSFRLRGLRALVLRSEATSQSSIRGEESGLRILGRDEQDSQDGVSTGRLRPEGIRGLGACARIS